MRFKQKTKSILLVLVMMSVIPMINIQLTDDQTQINSLNDFNENLKISDMCNPVEIAQFYDGGYAFEIFVSNNLAYVADGEDGLEIIDVSDPSNPQKISEFYDGARATAIYVKDELAYLCDDLGLKIINISDPYNPEKIGFYDSYTDMGSSPGYPMSIDISGNYAFLSVGDAGLAVVNITDPTSPERIGAFFALGLYTDVKVSGNWTYLVDQQNGLLAFENFFMGDNISLEHRWSYEGSIYSDWSIEISGDRAYLGSLHVCYILDISDKSYPYEIQKLDEFFVDGVVTGIKVVDNKIAYVAEGSYGLEIYDVFDPTQPQKLGEYTDNDEDQAWGIFLSGDLIYLADGSEGLEIIDPNFIDQPPDAPFNVQGHSGYHHINLSWDIPNDNFDLNTQYNIYRGEYSGGIKILVGNSLGNNYTDDSVEINKYYYYVITAENFIGESNESEEIRAIAGPYLKWESPEENALVMFPIGDPIFNFSCIYDFLLDIKLVINGINYGSAMDNLINLSPYSSEIDGPVNATLLGYEDENSIPIVSHSRNFTFSKLVMDVDEVLERDTKFIGEKLYLILHDPSGDNSFSRYEESEGLSMAFGLDITSGVSAGLRIGDFVEEPFCGTEYGATEELKLEMTTETGFDRRYEVRRTTGLKSSTDDSNEDYIGPGYGDRYWGETWTLKYELKGHHRAYFNGTDRYEDVEFLYGIIRGGEVFLNDVNAPQEWREQNPVHNGWQDVQWMDTRVDSGGAAYEYTYEVSESLTTTISVEIQISSETILKLPGLQATLGITMKTKMYVEATISDKYSVGYTIEDDESTDTIVQEWGIDQTFGTFIFRTNEFICETSYPLEHNTYDYLPPIISFPDIDLDSSQDGLAPCKDDSPLIIVEIFDEGEIQSALILYSTNDGTNWDSAILSEQVTNPGTWQGTIPAFDHGTRVVWYLKVWDLQGGYSNRTDPNGNPFSYTVINRIPSIILNTPNGNESYIDSVVIEWSGFDLDGDALTYTLAYSIEGVGWWLLDTGITDTSYLWDVSSLGYSDSVLIKVLVNDGFGGEAVDESDFLFSIGEPPDPSPETSLNIGIQDQSFSTDEFIIVFLVQNTFGQGISFATMQVWWDGDELPTSNIINLGGGSYRVLLSPITVIPGDDPILLNMSISASGYLDGYYEMYLAVDPEVLDKDDNGGTDGADGDDDNNGGNQDGLFEAILIIVGASLGIGVVAVATFFIRKRRVLRE
ncbi:MAG: hypothetical protein ACFFAT_06570 [Promethearchaeota archaeon]